VTFKKMPWVALLAVFALIVAACGGDDAADDTTTTDAAEVTTTAAAPEPEETTTTTEAAPEIELLVWADENRASAVEEVAPAFTEETGVIVNVELVDFGQIRDQVGVAGPAGEGPDVFIGASDWVGELATNGVLEPLDAGAWSGDFTDASLNALTFDGTLYGVPYAVEAIALYYNTELVAEAPATFDDLIAACEADEVEACLGVPGAGDGPDAYHNYPFISATGGYIFGEADGSYDPSDVGLDSEGAIAGAEFLSEITASGVLGATNYDEAKNLFLAGEQPFWITGPWELGGAADWEVAWSVAKIPTIDGGTPQPFIGVQAFFLSSFSENKLVAQSFLFDFIASQEGQNSLFAADGRPPVHSAIIDQVSGNAAISAFGASAADGVPIPNIPEMGSVWGALGDNLQLLRNGEVDATAAMQTAAESVRAALEG
jgi:maltose-binding protein MalE